ncbi:MAG: hypothetical protein ACR2OJ_14035 [Hyphomicrobiales bacterium]
MMSASQSLTPLRQEDYEAIESAVMETARGRWFLREYAHRNRNADTNVVLEAIGRIENALALNALEMPSSPSHDGIDANPLRALIDEARTEITQIRDELEDRDQTASSDPFVETVSSAGSISTSIFQQARTLQTAARKLREAGAHDELCDMLDDCASELIRICQRQDLNARRTAEAVGVLQEIDDKLSQPETLDKPLRYNDAILTPVGIAAVPANEDQFGTVIENDVEDIEPSTVRKEEDRQPQLELSSLEDDTNEDHIVFVETEGDAPTPPLVAEEPSETAEVCCEVQDAPENNETNSEADAKPLVFVP